MIGQYVKSSCVKEFESASGFSFSRFRRFSWFPNPLAPVAGRFGKPTRVHMPQSGEGAHTQPLITLSKFGKTSQMPPASKHQSHRFKWTLICGKKLWLPPPLTDFLVGNTCWIWRVPPPPLRKKSAKQILTSFLLKRGKRNMHIFHLFFVRSLFLFPTWSICRM